jgi:2-dehydro-3-deoxyphosphooctonate aldolase (KDO 8-P synthase)
VQEPGGLGKTTGGDRRMVPYLCRAAAGAGVDGFFLEVHENPEKAKSDGPNSLQLGDLEGLLKQLVAIDKIVKEK